MAEEKKDKAENELDLVSDCLWVRGLDANGKPIRILKSDLLDAMFKKKDTIINNSNFDNIDESGMYLNTVGNGSGNSNYPVNYGILLVFKFEDSYSAQISIGINEKTHIRLKFDGNWAPWKLISIT